MNEVLEVFYRWQQCRKKSKIISAIGIARKTVDAYVEWFKRAGFSQYEPFGDEQEVIARLKEARIEAVYPQPVTDSLEIYKEEIKELLQEEHVDVKQAYRILKERHDVKGSYSTLKRYVFKELGIGKKPVTVRLETEPGEQAQVDFGYAGLMKDAMTGKMRKTWAFVMTLSYSRHRFVRFVFSQDVSNWLECHEKAFEFFGGVPKTILLDNLKSGVIKPELYDPVINKGYAELDERHYGFVIDPARVRAPQHKGKVERAVSVVKRHLLAGREFEDINHANERAVLWAKEEIGMEVNGTTKKKPYECFKLEEKEM